MEEEHFRERREQGTKRKRMSSRELLVCGSLWQPCSRWTRAKPQEPPLYQDGVGPPGQDMHALLGAA